MLMVIVFVFLHLPAHQMEEEPKCPDECHCLNKTVAVCKDLKIDGINGTSGWKFEDETEILDLSGNKLGPLDSDIFNAWNVWNLHSFNLSGNSILNITHLTFSGITELENLDLSRNNISWIECEAFEVTLNIRVLHLRRNGLTEICTSTFSPLSQLQHLDISSNKISSIQSETLHNNSVLEWLSLANNSLTEIHPDTFISLVYLHYLDLSNNKISSIKPETLHNNSVLEWLSLATNGLTEIHPDTFSPLVLLQHLDLSNNNISYIKPETLRSNYVLQWLSLANNELTVIHPDTFNPLVNLQHLDLSNNTLCSIEPKTFHNNSVLEWMSLANNSLNEINLCIFQNHRKLPCLDPSGNINTKIEEAMFYCNRKLKSLLVSSNKNFEFIALDFCKESELNKTCKINYESCVGLENLKYLDLSNNSVRNISLSVFHSNGPQTEMNTSEVTCVSKFNGLNSSNNTVYSFNFGECDWFNLTSTILCTLEFSQSRENCLSIFGNNSMNLSTTVGALINLTDNSFSYKCSLSDDVVANRNVISLICRSQGDFGMGKNCNSELNDTSTTSLLKSVSILGIFAASIFVAIVVVLGITHIVGKPEPDEFWWEDKLAKRNY